MSFSAFVDESESRQDRDPGTYILSAAICETSMVPGLRESMESMRPASGAKLHWKQIRTGAARAAVLADVAALPVEHLVVVRLGGVRAPSERRRRVCLRRMLFELVELGVAHVVAESRGSADDRRDRNLLDALRA